MSAVQDIDRLRGWFAEKILGVNEFRGEHSVTVALDSIAVFLSRCHRDLGYDLLLDVSSVDHFGDDPRFEVVYELATVDDSKHLRVRSKVGEEEKVASATDLWPGADWHEREVWDFFGVVFDGPQLVELGDQAAMSLQGDVVGLWTSPGTAKWHR